MESTSRQTPGLGGKQINTKSKTLNKCPFSIPVKQQWQHARVLLLVDRHETSLYGVDGDARRVSLLVTRFPLRYAYSHSNIILFQAFDLHIKQYRSISSRILNDGIQGSLLGVCHGTWFQTGICI